jgi:hypothetical protein
MKSSHLLLILAAAAAPVALPAQPRVTAVTIAGGGGPGSGGTYTVNSTVGESAAGPASGGSYAVAAGFVPAVVAHSAGLPDLVLERTEAGIRLTWESPDAAVHLQRSAGLEGAPWLDTPAGVSNDGKTHMLQLGTSATEQYFRLSR